MQKAQINRLIGATIILLLVAAGSSLLAWWNPLEKQQLYLSNFLYYERPTKNQVVVVAIDDESISEDGLGKFSSWCRTYYVPVLEKLTGNKPAAIGIDVLFSSKSEGLCQDDVEKVLNSENPAEEITRFDKKFSHPDDIALGEMIKKISNVILLTNVRFDPNLNKNFSDLQVEFLDPIPELIGENNLLAHPKFNKDATDLLRSMLPAMGGQKQQRVLSLPVVAVLYSKGMWPIESIDWKENQISIKSGQKSLDIPLENSQMLINFSEKPSNMFNLEQEDSAIRVISFLDLHNDNNKDWSFLKDKIVLIGLGYFNSGDNYFIPLESNVAQPGVMIHAQAIQTILDQAWLRNQTMPERVGTIGLMAAAALALVFLLQIGWALPLLVILIGVYTMAAAPLLFRSQGLILNMVYPPLSVVAAAIAGYAYRYLSESRQKTRVAGALGQYVNTRVAEQVLGSDESQVHTGGEKRQITVIFTDILGFTTISESLQPQSLVALLNEYFEAMGRVIVQNGGIVDKYEGDALMAFFEDKPGQKEQGPAGQAERAAKAALEMRAELPKLNAKWKTDPPLPGGEKKPEIDFRVGISTGEALVGNIGFSQHIQYTVIGDIVNLGSRLEGANKKYRTHVMIAEATYELINSKYSCRFLDVMTPKGKQKPVKVYELICPADQLSDDQRQLIQAYNKALALYFQRQFAEALEVFQKEVFPRWPADVLSNFYAGRCELLKRFPPKPDWNFVYKMESK